MKAKLSIFLYYSSRYAYVDREFSSKELNIRFVESASSWKSLATLKFCFHGKRVSYGDEGFSVFLDSLDIEFLKIASRMGAQKYGIWRKVYERLQETNNRKEVLRELKRKFTLNQILKRK